MLLTLVMAYLVVTIAIGLIAAKRVKNSADFAIAGRHLPISMIITTTFATWFGSETVLGIPAKFVKGGLNAIVEDPFGAGLCLVLVGAFFAAKLYQKNLLTIGDFYRQRFGKDILIDLIRRETHGFSMSFAHTLVGQLSTSVGLINNPQRSAGFKVLKAPDVPAVLVELGYLSNKEDEQALASSQHRARLCEAMLKAIDCKTPRSSVLTVLASAI